LEELGHTVVPLQENALDFATVPGLARQHGAAMLLWTRTWDVDRAPALAALAALRAQGVVTVAYHLDRWLGLDREYQLDSEPFFRVDHVFTADGTDPEAWERRGIRHHWSPPGVLGAEARRAPQAAPRSRQRRHDVIFVGSHPYPHKEWAPVRGALIDGFAAHFGRRFAVWPNGRRSIRGRHLAALYQSAKVVLGDSCLVPPVRRYWCVDEQTEMLTRRGWLCHDQVAVGDMAYAMDPETGLARWSPVQAVNVYDREPRPMLSMESRGHSSLTTLDHRWLVESARNVAVNPNPTDRCPECGFMTRAPGSPRAISIHRAHAHGVHVPASDRRAGPRARHFRTSREIGQNDRIPVAAPCQTLPTEPKYSDALVELIAWVWTKGSWVKSVGRYTSITQSHRVNGAYVARIRLCLTSLFGPPARGRRPTPGWHEAISEDRGMTWFRVNAPAGRLLAQMAPDHTVPSEFIAELTTAQLRLFVETSIDADGCRKTSTKGGSASTGVTLAQKDPVRLDAFEMACALLGIATSRSKAEGCWLVHVKIRTFTAPMRSDLPLARREVVTHDGIVWCPTTSEGTWLARRNGTVYFTGNSDRIPETLGRGGCLIHPYVEGIDEWYPELPTFAVGQVDEAIEVAEKLLADDAYRRDLTTRQRELVLGRDTYTHRMQTMLQTVGLA
jgi:hypothetical protein